MWEKMRQLDLGYFNEVTVVCTNASIPNTVQYFFSLLTMSAALWFTVRPTGCGATMQRIRHEHSTSLFNVFH